MIQMDASVHSVKADLILPEGILDSLWLKAFGHHKVLESELCHGITGTACMHIFLE